MFEIPLLFEEEYLNFKKHISNTDSLILDKYLNEYLIRSIASPRQNKWMYNVWKGDSLSLSKNWWKEA